jgi:hypothetical protein
MKKIDLCKKVFLSFDGGTLLLRGPTRTHLPQNRGLCIWSLDSRVGAWRCNAIYYRDVSKSLFERFGEVFFDEVMEPPAISFHKVILQRHKGSRI